MKHRLHRVISDALIAPFFSGDKKYWQTHQSDLLRAIQYKPSWLLNRGVLRIIAEISIKKG